MAKELNEILEQDDRDLANAGEKAHAIASILIKHPTNMGNTRHSTRSSASALQLHKALCFAPLSLGKKICMTLIRRLVGREVGLVLREEVQKELIICTIASPVSMN